MSVMSWDLREGVAYYIARAVSAEGGYQLCNSTNSVCSFSTLGCGETYTFTVTAHRGQCQSDASAPVYLTTGMALCCVKNFLLLLLIILYKNNNYYYNRSLQILKY